MAKEKTVYVCTNCGQESPKWAGKCPSCGQWNTFVEEVIRKETPVAKHVAHGIESVRSKPQRLNEIVSGEEQRMDMCDHELNRVLGGGLVQGSLTLIGGEPGIGKSTLVLQTVLRLAGQKVLYISGEESVRQLKLRADRIPHAENSGNLLIACETSLEQIFTHIKNTAPDLVIIDSIQTISTENIDSSPGSIVQVRECSAAILKFAKETGTPVILIGHINKEGSIAGPKVLEHIVDTVLQFEGDQHYMYRILRSIKNRFGSTAELGIYEMRQDGLREVSNPSELLLTQDHEGMSGVAIACAVEGIRPFLIEVQALVSTAAYGMPQRSATGFDLRRMNMLLAVLEKRGALKVSGCDAFLNVIGGLSVDEPAADLAAVLALASSYLDKPIGNHVAAIGEVGLTGELRSVNHLSERLSEVHRLGFETCIIPKQRKDQIRAPRGLALIEARNIAEALRAIVQA